MACLPPGSQPMPHPDTRGFVLIGRGAGLVAGAGRGLAGFATVWWYFLDWVADTELARFSSASISLSVAGSKSRSS